MRESAIYTGVVEHDRRSPKGHRFRYRMFMMYLDLDELPTLFDGVPGWSARGPALARFCRADYHGDANLTLSDAVRRAVEARTGERPRGPIRMLTHLRYFGHIFNPVTFYYCFDETGRRVTHILAEITNTPWKERHCYVVRAVDTPASASADATPLPSRPRLKGEFNKQFHVSPFMDMGQTYEWHFTTPGDHLGVHMANLEDGAPIFHATLNLERRAITRRSLVTTLITYPAMTLRIVVAIYWQALRLRLKGVPFYAHPDSHSHLHEAPHAAEESGIRR